MIQVMDAYIFQKSDNRHKILGARWETRTKFRTEGQPIFGNTVPI